MPRAVIPPRLQALQLGQRVAAAQRDAQSAEKALSVEIATVSAGVPADLAAEIDTIKNRLDNLETP